MTNLLSWRALIVPVVAIAAGVAWRTAWRVTTECALSRGRPFDLGGSALWAGALLALMVGLSSLPAWCGAPSAAAVAIGVTLAVLMLLRPVAGQQTRS